MTPLVNRADQQSPCGVCSADDNDRTYYHVTSPDGRMQAERVVCEACLYEVLVLWYPNAVVDGGGAVE